MQARLARVVGEAQARFTQARPEVFGAADHQVDPLRPQAFEKAGSTCAAIRLESAAIRRASNQRGCHLCRHARTESFRPSGGRKNVPPKFADASFPIYEEDAVDQDLVDEGESNLKAYFQKKGYFDVTADSRMDKQGECGERGLRSQSRREAPGQGRLF